MSDATIDSPVAKPIAQNISIEEIVIRPQEQRMQVVFVFDGEIPDGMSRMIQVTDADFAAVMAGWTVAQPRKALISALKDAGLLGGVTP